MGVVKSCSPAEPKSIVVDVPKLASNDQSTLKLFSLGRSMVHAKVASSGLHFAVSVNFPKQRQSLPRSRSTRRQRVLPAAFSCRKNPTLTPASGNVLTASTRPSLVQTAVEGYVTYLTDGPLTLRPKVARLLPRTRGLSLVPGRLLSRWRPPSRAAWCPRARPGRMAWQGDARRVRLDSRSRSGPISPVHRMKGTSSSRGSRRATSISSQPPRASSFLTNTSTKTRSGSVADSSVIVRGRIPLTRNRSPRRSSMSATNSSLSSTTVTLDGT